MKSRDKVYSTKMMDFLKKVWPTPFKIKQKDVNSFVVQLVIFVVACAVIGILLGLLVDIPVVGIICVLLAAVLEIYGLIGIALCILKFIGFLK